MSTATPNSSTALNPAIKDGRSTRGLAIPKSHWANRIDEPPFEAYAVTCGLTFTFGGLKISNDGEVESTDGSTIPGLFAAGGNVAGLEEARKTQVGGLNLLGDGVEHFGFDALLLGGLDGGGKALERQSERRVLGLLRGELLDLIERLDE